MEGLMKAQVRLAGGDKEPALTGGLVQQGSVGAGRSPRRPLLSVLRRGWLILRLGLPLLRVLRRAG